MYILDISPLSDLGLVKILSQSVGGFFVLLTVSFALQKLCNFMRFEDFAERILIWLSLVRLCRCLANTEVNAHSQLLDGSQGPNGESREITQGAQGVCKPIGETTI